MDVKPWLLLTAAILAGCSDDDHQTHNNSVKFDVIDNQEFTLNPIQNDSNPDLESFSWTQTCGSISIIPSDTSQTVNLTLTAPKLDNDEEYCFQFKGTSKNGDQYSTDAKVSVVSPSLEVYVDHASLPSLHQVLDIIASAEAHPTAERYVSWGRINPTQEHLAQLNISRFPLESNHTSAEMLEAISAFAEDHHRLKVSISTNTLKSYDNLKLMLQRLHKQPHVDIDNIRLYDDGSAEYVNLYNWRNTQDKTYLLQQAGDNLKNIILGSGGSSAPWLTTQFNWHSLYPTEYSMLRSDFLTLDPKLHELKEYLGDSLKQMQWDKYAKLSSEQQALFLEIVGFDQNWLQVEYDKSPLANFVFTGTTTWAGGEEKEFYAKQQVNIINNAINETSPYYIGKEHDLFFKGHPRGGVINDIIISSFDNMVNIPSAISFEVLMMTDMLPDTIAGVASSLYFTIPAENIKFIVFTSSEEITDREQALKSPLVQVMMTLGIVKEENVLFWADMPDCSSGTCI